MAEETLPGNERGVRKQDRRLYLVWLLVGVLVFIVLFGCGEIAALVVPDRPGAEVRSVLSADYSYDPQGVFGAVGAGLIADAAGDSKLPFSGASLGSGCFLPGVDCTFTATPGPTQTPTATLPPSDTPTPTATPTTTATPTNTLLPTFTPTVTNTATNTPTPTPLVWPLKLVDPQQVDPDGDTVTVTILVVNYGNTTGAELRSVIDRLPTGMALIGGTCTMSPGPVVPCSATAGEVRWTFSPPRVIPQGRFVRFSFQAAVSGINPGAVLVNEAETQGDNFETAVYVRRVYAYTPTPTSTPVTVPVAGDDSYSTSEDVPLTQPAPGLLANDTDAAWDTLSASLFGAPSHGVVVINPDGSFVYTPAQDYNGIDSFTYQACDQTIPAPLCDMATVDLSISPLPDAPVGVDDPGYSVDEDGSLSEAAPGVLANDYDPDNLLVPANDGLYIDLSGSYPVGPLHAGVGGFTLNADGSFDYTPVADFNGTDQFTYQVCDDPIPSPSHCDTAVATITVVSVNDDPIAVDDGAPGSPFRTTDEDTAVTLPVLDNDSDPADGDPLTVVGVTQGANGSVTFTAGDVTYDPNPNWFGADSFTYSISDGQGGTDTASVYVEVLSVNDPPVAVDDPWPAVPSIVIGQGTSILIDVWANDYEDPIEGDTLYVSGIISAPASGGASTAIIDDAGTPADPSDDHSILYTPDPAYHDPTTPDTLAYELSDGHGGTDTATVTVYVNDAPSALGDAYAVDEDTLLSVPGALPLPLLLDNDNDPNGDPITAVLDTGPSHAAAFSFNPDGSFGYLPAGNYNGPDSFTYHVTDGGLDSAPATVSITVNPVNDPPVAVDDLGLRTNQDTDIVIDVLANDIDVDLDPLIVDRVNPAGHVAIDVSGTFVTYSPISSFVGTYVFTYDVCDPSGACDTGSVSVLVSGAPTAVDDIPAEGVSYVTGEDVPLNVPSPGVLGNDTDPNNDPLTASLSTPPTNGLVSLNPDGSFTYTPSLNFNGTDGFSYQACDPGGPAPLCDTASVEITVNAANDPPVALNDACTVTEDTAVDCVVLTNDGDVDGSLVVTSVLVVTSPLHGTATPNNDGTITYDPDWNYEGGDSFSYTVEDNAGATSNAATVTVTVNGVNDPPVAISDYFETSQRFLAELDRLVVVAPGVLSNDYDPEGQPLTVLATTPPAHQTTWITYPWEWFGDGAFNYAPLYGYHGYDSFTYTVCDDTALCSTATVYLAVNDRPSAVGDSYSVSEDSTLLVSAASGLLSNDTDENAAPPADLPYDVIEAHVVAPPAAGTLGVNPDGSFSYDPDANYFGPDTFQYEACDQGVVPIQAPLCDTATVTINVNPVNDPPVAVDDSGALNSGGSVILDLLANDGDIDSNLDPASMSLDTSSTVGSVTDHGDGTVTVDYGAAPGFYGSDSFTYTVQDDHVPPAVSNTATVSISVNAYPVASDSLETTPEDTPLLIDLAANVSDADGTVDGNSVAITSAPAHGSLWNLGGGSYRYTPDADYNGVDAFRFTADDNLGATSNEAQVQVNITPVDDTPRASADSYSMDEDDSLSATVPGLLANDSDPDGTGLTVDSTPVSGPPAGHSLTLNADGSFTFIPLADFNGLVTFEYRVCDDAPSMLSCDTATVSITVDPVNDPPIAVDDGSAGSPLAALEDTPLLIDVLANDYEDPVEGDTLSVASVTQGGHGAVANNGGSVTYTPASNWSGDDSFSYTLSDGSGGTDTATVYVRVNPVNDPPVAMDDTSGTSQFAPVAIGVLANDSDIDGGPLVIQSFDASSVHGASITQSGNDLIYTPGAYSSPLTPDSFGYTVSDGNGGTDNATVRVLVNDAPQATGDSYSTAEDVPLLVGAPGVLANDGDVNGDPLTLTLTGDVSHGSLSLNADGSFSYTPAGNYYGGDSFGYSICDAPSGGLCDSASVSLSVSSVNDLPTAGNDSFVSDQATAVSGAWRLDVAANDSDLEGPLNLNSIVIVTPPAHGSAVPDAANPGQVIYTLSDARFISDSFSYTIQDADGAVSNSATVSISITSPDLQIDKSAMPDNVAVGDTVDFFITVWNNGPGTAFDVQLSDQLGSCFQWLAGENPSGPLGRFDEGDAMVVVARARLVASSGCAVTNQATVTSMNGASASVQITVGLEIPLGGVVGSASAVAARDGSLQAQPARTQAAFTLLVPVAMIIAPLLAEAAQRRGARRRN